MIRKPTQWLAASGWLVTGMLISFMALMKFAPQLHTSAVAAPAAAAASPTPPPSAPPPASGPGCDARALSQAFVQVAARLKPAVVTIMIEKKPAAVEGNPFGGGPFDEFFRRFRGPGMRMRPQLEKGLGSGFLIDKAGHVLTNNHVVDGADRVQVITNDGRRLQGKVIGTDKTDDLAVVKVDGLSGIEPVKMGDSDKLQVGELVMAIGSPFGLDQTVTVGVVSARGRRLDGTPYAFEDFVQTDASINHGNSGGPLVNMNGEVVGVNSRIAGEGTGIGFSVSSNVARRVTQALIKDGHVRRPFIGVGLQDLTPDMAPQLRAQKGVVINSVVPSSPAQKAGLAVYDVITAVDGREVTRSDEVVRAVQSHQVGQQLKLQILRSGAPRQITLATADAPTEAGKASYASGGESGSRGRYGVELQDLTPQLAQELGVRTDKGAVVAAVEPGSPADHAGLQEGDVIVEVDRRPVANGSQVVGALKGGGAHLLRVEKGGQGARFITISPEK